MEADGEWPEAVSDGLTLPCARCGVVPSFDYRVRDTLWLTVVPKSWSLGVVCLPCLDQMATDVGLDVSQVLEEVQFTGIGKTIVLKPERTHRYKRPTNTRQEE